METAKIYVAIDSSVAVGDAIVDEVKYIIVPDMRGKFFILQGVVRNQGLKTYGRGISFLSPEEAKNWMNTTKRLEWVSQQISMDDYQKTIVPSLPSVD